MNFSFEIESLYSPTTIDIGVKPKANYRQYLSILPIIRFRLFLGFTAKLKLYSDYPDSDGFFADFLGEVTSESLLAEREGFKPPKRTSRFPDFESGPFGHSGISPKRGRGLLLGSRLRSAKLATIIGMSNRQLDLYRGNRKSPASKRKSFTEGRNKSSEE